MNAKNNASEYNPYSSSTSVLCNVQGYKVAGYLRLSVEDGDKDVSDSIVSQRSIIENKVRELGDNFELVDFYIDDGYTGLNTNRPDFQRMLKDIENHKINTIITKDLSRLSRNSFEANYFIELYFLERNIRYISVLDNVDTYLKNSNNDMIQFKTLINDWYSKDISKKVRAGVWSRKEKGLYLGAYAPYGYIKDPNNKNKLIINKEEARVVKIIFDMYDKGETLISIAKYLDNTNTPCPRISSGKVTYTDEFKWAKKSLGKMLRNKVYLGHIEYGKRINLSYKSEKVKYIPQDEWKIVYNTHEPIILQEQFDRIQTKINLNKKIRNRKFDWLLNGLVYCKECNSKMILKTEYDRETKLHITSQKIHCSNGIKAKNRRLACDRLSKGLSEEVLTKLVLASVNETVLKLLDKEKLQELVSKEYKENSTKMFDDNIKTLEKQLSKVDANIKSLYQDYKDGILEEDDYKRFYKTETDKKSSIKANIDITKQDKEKCMVTIEKPELLQMIDKLSKIDNWSKDKLSEIIYNIEVDKDNKIYINYRYDVFNKIA
jgi:DNA invertase Pin-like site-specific DNA recombinase